MTRGVPRELEPGPRALRTRRLVKRFGGEAALVGVDLDVPEGAVYVLVGPNGAGKTTTLRILLDLLRPDEGAAEVMGISTLDRPHEVRAQIGYVPERHNFHYGWIRVEDLVAHHARYHPAWDPAYARELTERLHVPTEKKYAHLSKGQARRVQLLLALAHRPPVLILDEPTDGLDPVGKEEVLGLLADHLASSATTVLVSTHLIYEVEGLGDHLGVMKEGRLTAQVTRDELHERLKRYLLVLPDGREPPTSDLRVLTRRRAGREMVLDVWGEEEEVRRHLEAGDARVREVSPLSLEESAVSLLKRGDEPGEGAEGEPETEAPQAMEVEV